MANKNTRSTRRFVSQAGKKGHSEIEIAVPVRNYHSHGGSKDSFFVKGRIPTARVHGEGEISSDERRNMRMRVLHNSNGVGGKDSMTVHEPISDSRPVRFKNHNYVQKDGGYYQPKGITH